MKDVIRQVVNVLATAGVLTINGLANAVPFNGLTTGDVSEQFDRLFVPAAYVFAIWGVIYAAIVGFTVYQALPSQRKNPLLRRIGYLYALTCVANSAWLFLWHYEQFVWSLVAMGALLLLLIAIYLRIGTGRTGVGPAETWLVRVPFSIYLGWITVATIANATVVLEAVDWNGWGLAPEVWAILMLVVAGLIASTVSITRGDVAYILVILWAYVGIVIRQSDTPSVAITAGVVAGIVALTLIVGVPLARRRVQAWHRRQPQAGIHPRW
jgi:hypothetical protein